MQTMDTIKQSVRHTYGRVQWTHKIHEKQADIYLKKYKCLEIWKIITSCITSAGIITLIFNDTFAIKIAAVIVSVIAACLAAISTTFNLQKMADQHRKTATEILGIREALHLLLLKIKIRNVTEDEALKEYEKIEKRLEAIYANAPSTTTAAVKRAEEKMGTHGDNEITNEEINSGLPDSLKE